MGYFVGRVEQSETRRLCSLPFPPADQTRQAVSYPNHDDMFPDRHIDETLNAANRSGRYQTMLPRAELPPVQRLVMPSLSLCKYF